MKKSWKPQVRSFFVNKVPFWILMFFITVTVCIYFYSVNNIKYIIYSALLYAGLVLSDYYYVKRWNKGGYEKITIDTGKKLIIFDDKTVVHFKNIVNIEYVIENNPNIPLLFRKDIYDNGRIDILKINAELLIQCFDGKFIRYSIQNKFAAKGILRTLKKSGFNVGVTDERTLNYALLIRIIIVAVCTIALIIIKLHEL